MSALTQQLEQLKKQQEELEKRIQDKEERNKKDGYTLERLEACNKGSDKRRKHLAKQRNRNLQGTSELIMINHTNHRFEVILEILKKQDERIKELETKLHKPQEHHQ
jgi:hypothetical protein